MIKNSNNPRPVDMAIVMAIHRSASDLRAAFMLAHRPDLAARITLISMDFLVDDIKNCARTENDKQVVEVLVQEIEPTRKDLMEAINRYEKAQIKGEDSEPWPELFDDADAILH